MNGDAFYIVVAIFLVLAVATLLRYARTQERAEKWLPRELRNAELAYAETLFRSGGNVPIVAKCDRGYRTRKGEIVLLELKTRKINRVYPSDVIELSAQRYAIHLQTGEPVANHAYVLIQHASGESVYLHRVKLMDLNEVAALAQRRRAILTGAAAADYAQCRKLCKHCSFATECKAVA